LLSYKYIFATVANIETVLLATVSWTNMQVKLKYKSVRHAIEDGWAELHTIWEWTESMKKLVISYISIKIQTKIRN